jgi:hypothetical protein
MTLLKSIFDNQSRITQKAKDKMNKKAVIITAFAAVLVTLVGFLIYNRFIGGPARMNKALVKVSSDINRTLPMMLEKDTRLDTTIPGPGKRFTYVNTIVNYELAQIDTVKMRQALTPNIIANYKTQKDMESFRKDGVMLCYRYKDKNGVFLIQVETDPKDF